MSIDRPPAAPGAVDAWLARELGELARACLAYPWGSTAVGNRTLVRLMRPEPVSGAPLHRVPVVLVHGYGGNRSNWLPVEVALRRAGFADVHTAAYNPVTTSLHDIARRLVTGCAEAMERAGTDHVHLVGHSLGGIVVRYAVQRLGLAAAVGTAVTVATPHRGTPVASLTWGAVARALRPGSPFLEDLRRDAGDADVRWVAYSAERDLVVPPDYARLDGHGCSALDVPVPGVGHLGILRAPAFLRSVVQLLLAAEEPAQLPTPRPASTAPPIATVA